MEIGFRKTSEMLIYELKLKLNWFGFEIYKRPIGVIISKVIKETGIRLWIYSLSKPKTTLITIRGVMIQNEVVGMVFVLTEGRER